MSAKHANFIVNAGQATAADMETLVAHMQARVLEKLASRSPRKSARRGRPLMRLHHDPKLVRHVTEAKEFGRVAVLFGGTSSEREISLLSGNACSRR